MKIFLDTADTQLIQDGFNTGLIDGVTTNPTLIMKSGRDPEEVYQELIDFGLTDISMEVVGNRKEMYQELDQNLKHLSKQLTQPYLLPFQYFLIILVMLYRMLTANLFM